MKVLQATCQEKIIFSISTFFSHLLTSWVLCSLSVCKPYLSILLMSCAFQKRLAKHYSWLKSSHLTGTKQYFHLYHTFPLEMLYNGVHPNISFQHWFGIDRVLYGLMCLYTNSTSVVRNNNSKNSMFLSDREKCLQAWVAAPETWPVFITMIGCEFTRYGQSTL